MRSNPNFTAGSYGTLEKLAFSPGLSFIICEMGTGVKAPMYIVVVRMK